MRASGFAFDRAQLLQAISYPLLRIIADGTGIQQDQIGFLELACQAKTVLVEDGSHDLAVTKVHLATITFQVEQTAGSCLFHLLPGQHLTLSVIRQKRFLLVKCWILIIHGANLQRMTVNLTAKHQYLYPATWIPATIRIIYTFLG